MQWNSPRFSEIHHWIIITEPFPLQFKCEFTTESGEFNTIIEGRVRRRRKKIRRIWTGEEEEEEKSPIYFRNSSQEINKQNQNSRVLEDSGSNLRIKTQVNTWTYLFLAQEHQQIQIDVDPWKFKEFHSKNCETLKTLKTVKIPRSTTNMNRCRSTNS